MEKEVIDLTQFETKTGRKYKVTMKPVINFNSIEMECECTEMELQQVLADFRTVYEGMKAIVGGEAQPQPKKASNKKYVTPSMRPSLKQIELMQEYGIEFDESTTKDEARKLIMESYKSVKDVG